MKSSLQKHVEKKQVASKLYRDGLHPKGRSFDLYQPVRVKNTRGGKEKWIPGIVVAVKGPETYLPVVRAPGNDRRYVHANHLIPDDARGMSAHKKIVTPEMIEHDPSLDFQRERAVPETRLRIQSEVDNEISRKSSVIAVPVVHDDSNVESGDNSGLQSPDQVVTKPVMPSHSESRPRQVVTRSGWVIKRPERLHL